LEELIGDYVVTRNGDKLSPGTATVAAIFGDNR